MINLYQVDAFTSHIFGGNPAAVCPLNEWLSDDLLQKIATENNLSETCFFVPNGELFHIRWFTPAVEVRLCGHATLAAAHVLWQHLGYENDQIVFQSMSGELKVKRSEGKYLLDFPADTWKESEEEINWSAILGVTTSEVVKGITDYLICVDSEEVLKNLKPDFAAMSEIDARGVIVTAKGEEVDFVSRFFAPQSGIPEDPVTGSAHTTLVPFWKKKMNQTEFHARQISSRGGELFCKDQGERIEIAGYAKTYLSGTINLN